MPRRSDKKFRQPDKGGHFGIYGGKFVPETLMAALDELETVYRSVKSDPKFKKELNGYLHDFAGRPSPLTETKRLAKLLGVKRLFLKREDLLKRQGTVTKLEVAPACPTIRMTPVTAKPAKPAPAVHKRRN